MKNSSHPARAGRVPLSNQIAEALIRDIKAGVLPDGERLPPERTMAKNLGIAVGTLRRALAELERRGLLQRVQGSGNYISHPLDIADVYALFRLELKSGPATPAAQLLNVRRVKNSARNPLPLASALAHRFRRIRRLDGQLAALEEIWLDGSWAESINETLIADSLYLFYSQHLGLRITRAEDRVTVAELPAWAPDAFVQRGVTHWGFVERLSQDQDGQIAEYSRTWFDPEHVQFVSR